MDTAVPVLPWIGGKRRLAPQLLALFPPHRTYVEPFCGAAALFFLKARSPVEVLNDVHGDLVTLYRVLQHHPEEFLRQFRWALSSRQLFTWLQQTPPATLTDIQRAARFWYLQRHAFGGKVVGQTFGTDAGSRARLNLFRLEEDLTAAHLRLDGVVIEQLDWAECVTRYDRADAFFYLDPPYWETEGYGAPFPLEQYERIAALARSIAGKMLISVNDHPAMRAAFKGLAREQVGISYSVGKAKASRVRRQELVLRNW